MREILAGGTSGSDLLESAPLWRRLHQDASYEPPVRGRRRGI